MKKLILSITLLIIAATAIQAQGVFKNNIDATQNGEAATPKNKITGSVEVNYLRHYLWRGMLFGNNDVAQPELELNYRDFTLTLAQNLNYVPQNVPKEYYTRNAVFDEQDVEITYTRNWGKFSSEFSAMAYFYFYQRHTPNTAELYNNTAFNFYKGFSVFTENSVDVAAYKGAVYSNNGIMYEKTCKNDIEIECSAFAAFANKKFNEIYYYEAKPGLNLTGINGTITKNIRKYFIKATAEKNWFVRRNVKEATALNGSGNFIFAAGVNF